MLHHELRAETATNHASSWGTWWHRTPEYIQHSTPRTFCFCIFHTLSAPEHGKPADPDGPADEFGAAAPLQHSTTIINR